ncbi:MAG TPA: glutathione S-transferase family protein [Caulobacteraceae bacterium]|jgi:glutathione S-transferase|nr:glutathione S-transferase family protein [Caulobacteraceae bacterium]
MLTLFHAPRSRSSRFIWLLEELGPHYEIEYVTIQRGDGSGAPDPKNPHPHKQVPALIHDETLVTESAAIALYLTDLHPGTGLGPLVGDPGRGAYLTWLAYYAGVLEPVVVAHSRGASDERDLAAYQALDERLKATLEAGPYLLGEAFSAADILYVSLLQFGRNLLPDHKVYDDYLARLNQRPAVTRALQKDAP